MSFDLKVFHKTVYWMSLIGLVAMVSNLGFTQSYVPKSLLNIFYFSLLGLSIISTALRYLNQEKFYKSKVFIFDLLSILFTLWVFYIFLFTGD